jgi:hypothetical protein
VKPCGLADQKLPLPDERVVAGSRSDRAIAARTPAEGALARMSEASKRGVVDPIRCFDGLPLVSMHAKKMVYIRQGRDNDSKPCMSCPRQGSVHDKCTCRKIDEVQGPSMGVEAVS